MNLVEGGTNDRHYLVPVVASRSKVPDKFMDAFGLVCFVGAERHNPSDHAVDDAKHHSRRVA